MLIVYHNRRHPRVDVPHPTVRQPHGRSPLVFVLLLMVVLAAMGAAIWGAYDIGRQSAGFHSNRADQALRELEARIAGLETERDDLRQQVATLERDAQIEREAAKNVQESLIGLQDERLAFKEEIALLNSLLSDGKKKAGLRVRGFELVELEEPGTYRYHFAVSKLPQSDDEVKVNLEMAVYGSEDGKEKRLPLKEIAIGDPPAELAFKQLTQVEGDIGIPEEIEPSKVKIVIKPKDSEVLGAEREFSWSLKP